MTYNVFSGMLNVTQSLLNQSMFPPRRLKPQFKPLTAETYQPRDVMCQVAATSE